MSTTVLHRDSAPTEGRSLAASVVGLVRPWRTRLLVVTLLVLGAATLELVPPFVIRVIVDQHLLVGRSSGLLVLALLYLAASAAVQAMSFLYGYLAATIAQGVLSRLRVRLFAHLQRLPASYFDRTPLGDVISRCTSDIETLETVFSSGVAVLVANLVKLVTVGAGMVVLSPPLTLVAALVVPPMVWTIRWLQVRVRRAERDTRTAVGAMTARLHETLGGAEVVRAFGREAETTHGFRQALARALAASNRSTLFSAFYPPVTAILAAVAVAVLLSAGTQRIVGIEISIGTLTAFAILLQRFFQPLTALGEEWQTVQSGLAGAERIFATLALAPERVAAGVAAAPRSDERRPIHLGDVVFGYEAGQPVLRGISLTVGRGEHVALVGRTGAGKTSTLHLLAGLYAPWRGSVRVVGRDPHALEEAERRRFLGVVPQTVQLFSGTILDNLSLGDPSVSEHAMLEAARIAGADGFIRALPQGYQTPLSGDGGGIGRQLSAGQQQLLSLARALVHEPAVLLLDEATAAIDGTSDVAFRAALRASVLSRGCAVLTVAHRLSTAVEADRVVVLDRGEIVEQGPPTELVRQGGRFAALLELEAAGWDWRSTSA
jgi:ATP-binding cassette subfamily B multidrug efflux pump